MTMELPHTESQQRIIRERFEPSKSLLRSLMTFIEPSLQDDTLINIYSTREKALDFEEWQRHTYFKELDEAQKAFAVPQKKARVDGVIALKKLPFSPAEQTPMVRIALRPTKQPEFDVLTKALDVLPGQEASKTTGNFLYFDVARDSLVAGTPHDKARHNFAKDVSRGPSGYHVITESITGYTTT